MQSKTSWYKKELFKQNFRQVGWVSLIYFIILFFAVPLNIFMQFSQPQEDFYDYYSFFQGVFNFGVFVQIFALFIVPVLMAMFILRYLHQKDASDFLHSLPIKRSQLFWQQILFGLVGLSLPIIINGGLTYLVSQMIDVSPAFGLTDIGYWLVMTLIIMMFVYSLGLILGTLTGITIIQGIFTYIFMFLPVGFVLLFISNLNYVLIGLPENHIINDRIIEYSPITNIDQLIYNETDNYLTLLIYFLITLVFFFIGQYLYNHRPSEAATQAIAFHKLKLVFIYSFTFCFTLIGGIYFASFQQSYIGILIGYLIFSIIGYFITQMIIHKTWRVFREWREYIFFLIGFVVILCLVLLDITGYQSRIPKAENIVSAYVVEDYYNFEWSNEKYGMREGFKTNEEIKMVQEYHQYLIDASDRKDWRNNYYKDITIIYQLENGGELVREYNRPELTDSYDPFEVISQSPVYKKYTEEVFLIEPEVIDEISISAYPTDKAVSLTSRKQIEEFVDLYRLDLLEEDSSYAQIGSSVDFIFDDYSQTYSELNWNHTRVIDWLMKNDLLDLAMLVSDDIESIVIAHPDDIEEFYYSNEYDYYRDILPHLKKWEFTDPAQITTIIEQVKIKPIQGAYLLAIYIKDQWDPYVLTINKSDLPTEISDQIN